MKGYEPMLGEKGMELLKEFKNSVKKAQKKAEKMNFIPLVTSPSPFSGVVGETVDVVIGGATLSISYEIRKSL